LRLELKNGGAELSKRNGEGWGGGLTVPVQETRRRKVHDSLQRVDLFLLEIAENDKKIKPPEEKKK